MNWNSYLLLYCGICYIIFICVYSYTKRKDPKRDDIELWKKLIVFIATPLLPVIMLLYLLLEGIDRAKESIGRKMKEKKEMKIKESLGLGPNEEYLCFWKMGGVGLIRCKDCGYEEKIICCTHGFSTHGLSLCTIGRQCPNCHSFVSEDIEDHTEGKIKEDFVCHKCGAIIRKKEASHLKGNDVPLLCPQCTSARLSYKPLYFT